MDSPAMAAGLQSGDVITEIDGEAVISVDGYQTKLLSLTPGRCGKCHDPETGERWLYGDQMPCNGQCLQ